MVQISQISAAMLCALHGMFAFAHFSDPEKLMRDMMGPAAAKSLKKNDVAVHALAVIGAFHVFTCVLFSMIALIRQNGLRKCALAIYLFTFVPIGGYIQYAFPSTGKAPASPMDMPMPVIYTMGAAALLALVPGGPSAPKSKTK